MVAAWEVLKGAAEGRGGGAAPVGDEGLDFAAQFVEVVLFEWHFETGAEVAVVEVTEDAQSHFHVGLALDAVEETQQYMLGDFDFGVALPAVPHALRAVEDDEQAVFLGLLLGAGRGAAGSYCQ